MRAVFIVGSIREHLIEAKSGCSSARNCRPSFDCEPARNRDVNHVSETALHINGFTSKIWICVIDKFDCAPGSGLTNRADDRPEKQLSRIALTNEKIDSLQINYLTYSQLCCELGDLVWDPDPNIWLKSIGTLCAARTMF